VGLTRKLIPPKLEFFGFWASVNLFEIRCVYASERHNGSFSAN